MALDSNQHILLPTYDVSSLRANAALRGVAVALRDFLSRYGLLVAFAVLWQVSPSLGWTKPSVLPPLSTILVALWRGITIGTFPRIL